MWPVFVVEGMGIKQPISAMPGQFRYSVDTLLEAVGEVMAMGIKSLMVFGVVGDERKSPRADYAWNRKAWCSRRYMSSKKLIHLC